MHNKEPIHQYLLPVTPSYWKEALCCLKQLRCLVLAALCVALAVILNYAQIPVGPNLKIMFTFLADAIMAIICGPILAIPYGIAQDLINYFLYPTGGFFPGYTLSTVCMALCFALFFFRARITVLRIILCKLTINVFVNILMGCLWSSILYGQGYYFYLAKSVVKNLVWLPVEVILLVLMLRFLIPILSRAGLCSPLENKRIPFI